MKETRKDMYLFSTFKISGAAILAIAIAYLLKLDYAVSAGIVAILTIQPTKKETIKTAMSRWIAFICALVIAYSCFRLIDFSLKAFFIYLIIFIFLCQIFNWYSAIAMNSVLISHFLSIGVMDVSTVLNECLIFFIGAGIGIIANLHLHKDIDYIEKLKEQTDNQMRKILARMSERIINSDVTDYNGECFVILKDSIRNAKNVADENYKNQFRKNDIYDKEYIRMRERQCQVLFEMYKDVRHMQTTPMTAKKISVFLANMSEVYHQLNTGQKLLEDFYILDASMKKEPLPTKRTEFEDRARLYFLLRHMEEFITLKVEFAKQHVA